MYIHTYRQTYIYTYIHIQDTLDAVKELRKTTVAIAKAAAGVGISVHCFGTDVWMHVHVQIHTSRRNSAIAKAAAGVGIHA